MRHRLGLATRTQISVCKSPFPSAGTAVSLFRAKTVQQRPRLPREVETWLPDCGVTITVTLWGHSIILNKCYNTLGFPSEYESIVTHVRYFLCRRSSTSLQEQRDYFRFCTECAQGRPAPSHILSFITSIKSIN